MSYLHSTWQFLHNFWLDNQDNVLGKSVRLLFYLLVVAITHRIVRYLLSKRFRERLKLSSLGTGFQRQRTILTVLANAVDYIFIFLYVYVTLTVIGIPVQTLLASAGIAGLTIGLAAQDFISDVINGIFIMIERTYEVGEEVIIDTNRGKVIDVGLRLTTLQALDGRQYFIRNGTVNTVTNLSRMPIKMAIDLPIDLIQLKDPEALDRHLKETTESLAKEYITEFSEPPVLRGLIKLNELNVYVYRIIYTMDRPDYLKIRDQLYHHYIQSLEEAGFSLRN